ncbi:hypothetical protein CDD81_4314 [Ophiocordyceps australis]|uniref:Uncharacterized protein n=1 Tax=Ophiocordyceps australis TaxID=1399860 RepID=A0A2C5Y4W6_9HYPO|nr:hypothetical protein CDD81_4314 [Ophiocordyceps australis]
MDSTEPAATMFVGNERAQAIWERMLKVRAEALERSRAIQEAYSAQLQEDKLRAEERYKAIQDKRKQARLAKLDRLVESMQKCRELEDKMREVARRGREEMERAEALVVAGLEGRVEAAKKSGEEGGVEEEDKGVLVEVPATPSLGGH